MFLFFQTISNFRVKEVNVSFNLKFSHVAQMRNVKEIDDTAKEGLTIFWKLFTMILRMPKHLKC